MGNEEWEMKSGKGKLGNGGMKNGEMGNEEWGMKSRE